MHILIALKLTILASNNFPCKLGTSRLYCFMAGRGERERREEEARGAVVTLACPLIIDEFMAQLDGVRVSQYFLASCHTSLAAYQGRGRGSCLIELARGNRVSPPSSFPPFATACPPNRFLELPHCFHYCSCSVFPSLRHILIPNLCFASDIRHSMLEQSERLCGLYLVSFRFCIVFESGTFGTFRCGTQSSGKNPQRELFNCLAEIRTTLNIQ